jgi:amidase
VGAGLVDIALGADQGGSIRVPAALCGIVGLKPTFGLLPYTGIGSNDAINDHAGPLARTVMEVAECLEATAGYDGIDDRQLGACAPNQVRFSADLKAIEASGLQGFKIGILKEAFEMPILDARVAQKVLTAAAMFKTLGATVEEVSVPLHPAGNAIWTAQQRLSGCLTMLGLTHGRRGLGLTGLEQTKLPWTQAKFDKCFATTQNVFLNGQYLIQHFPTIYPKALNLGRRLRDEYEAVLQEFDVLILPTTSFVARKHGIRDNTRPIEQIKPTVGLTANTVQFNATGQPAMNLPIGRLSAEDDPEIMLPVGMQIVSGLWRDNVVLRVGHVWEKNFDWKQL